MEPPFAYTVDSAGQRLDVFLVKQSGETRTFVKKQIESGTVKINGQVINKTSHRLKEGDAITGCFEEKPDTKITPLAGQLDVVFEDKDLIVINKSQGLVVHPARRKLRPDTGPLSATSS